MPVVVQKYGGSSVADLDKLRAVAAQVAATRRSGNDVVVVVSAMGKTTDALLAMAREASRLPDGSAGEPPRRELDMLLSTGERVSMSLLSIAMQAHGLDAISFTGSQSGIITNDRHFDARIIEVRPFRIEDEIARGRVVIVAGYQGMSYRREITTLGRGGSDTTAVALAAALGADRCEIYSDVDGVYTADPRSVPEARHLPAIDLAVLQEMAEAGAKVLNAQAVEWARRSRIVIHARRTGDRHDAEPRGRETVSGQPGADSGVRAVVAQRNVALLRVAEQQASLLLEAAARAGLALGDVAFGQTAVAAVPLLNVPDFGRVQRELSAGVPGLEVERPLGMLSLVGAGIGARPEHLQRALGLLASTPRFVISSALRLSCLLPEAELPAAERAWHAELVPRGFDQLSPASASA